MKTKKIIFYSLIAVFLFTKNLSAGDNIEREILKEWHELSSKKPLLAPGKTVIPAPKQISMTMFLNKVKKNWKYLSSSTQNLLAPILLRPTDPFYRVRNLPVTYDTAYSNTETSHFKIFYTNGGKDAVQQTDIYPTGGNFIPDFVDIIAEAFESSYTIGVTNKGYDPPPDDFTDILNKSVDNNGGSPRYDVYLLDIGKDFPGVFGWTQAEGTRPFGNSYVNYSFIVMDNNFDTSQYDTSQTPENFARITAAHEFYHAIEFGYNTNVDEWFMEASAVWFEDQVFPSIDDYIKRYLVGNGGWLWTPELPLDYEDPNSSFHEYGSGIWPMFLEKNHSNLIKNFWVDANKTSSPSVFNILESLLKNKSSSLYSAFGKFTTWNFLTGKNYVNDGNHYPDGALYTADTTLYIFDTITSFMTNTQLVSPPKTKLPGYLGSNYIIFTPGGSPSSARIMFDGSESLSKNLIWSASAVIQNGATYTETTLTLNNQNAGGLSINASFDSIILIPGIYETTHLRSDITSFGYIYGLSDDTTAPSPVPALTAADIPADNGYFIALNWTASPTDTAGGDIEYYDVLRSTTSGSGFEVVKNITPDHSAAYSYNDRVNQNKISYYYIVRPRDKWLNYNSTGEIEKTAIATDDLPPAPPTEVSASDTPKDEGTSIDVKWKKSDDDGNGANDLAVYTVFHCTTRTGPFETAGVAQSGDVIFHDTTVIKDIVYYYYLRAEDSNPNYSYSTAYYFYNTTTTDTTHDIWARAIDDFVPPPANFKAIGVSNNIALVWKNPVVSDFVKTFIMRKTDTYPNNVNDGTKIYEGIDSTLADANVVVGQKYYYTAISYDSAGNYSEPDSGSKTQATITLEAFNYPNPTYNGETRIRYQLENTNINDATLYIFDIAGELVLKIDSLLQNSNNAQPVSNIPVYEYLWDGKNGKGNYVASGVYIFVVKANDNISKSRRTGKIAVIR